MASTWNVSSMDPWRLTTLGQYALTRDGTSVAPPATLKARALLVFLALHRHADVSRERLLELLWPLADPERARANLKTATWSVRRVLRDAGTDPDASLAVGRATLRWIAPTEIDVERVYAAARADADTNAVRAALGVWGGEFLEGDYEEWVVAERERVASAYETALRRLTLAGDESAARILIERDPYDGGAFAVAVGAAERRGDRAEGRRLRERHARACEELGIAPTLPAPEAKRSAPDRLTPPPIRFAGREREAGIVRDALERARGGRGSVVGFVGEAGIGKTAVLDRAREAANGLGFRVLAAPCVVDDPRTFGPWEAVFESLIGSAFVRFARASGSDAATRLAVELVAALPGPSVLLVDDLHALRGEAETVAAAFAARAAAAGHVLVVAARPTGSDVVRRLVDLGGGAFAELGRLDHREVRAALAAQRDLPAPLADALFRRSGGHPLFLVGLVDVLARGGASGGTSPADLPPTLRATFEAQLRARGEFSAEVACALALEPSADGAMLAAALGRDEAAVADALDDLIALRAVLQPEHGPPFAFAHDLLAEVAAGLLPRPRRTRLHRAFAAALATSRERGAATRRARHLQRAGRPEEAALAYAVAAGEALEWYAPQTAAELADAGLRAADAAALPDDAASRRAREAMSCDLYAALARARVLDGDDARASGPVAHAVHAARAAGPAGPLCDALALEAAVALNCHRIDQAVASAAEAVAIAQGAGNFVAAARASISLCHAYAHAATQKEALRAGADAVRFAEASGDASALAAALDALVRAQIVWWHFAAARATSRLQREAARRAGWLPEAAALCTSALVDYYCGRHGRARDDLDAALAIASDETGERRWMATAAGLDRLKVRFFARYIGGVVSLAAGDVSHAAAVAAALDGERLSDTSYMIRNNVVHLWIDALLENPTPAAVERARGLLARLRPDQFEQGSVLDLSGSLALARARIAAFGGAPDAFDLLELAYRDVDAHARTTPLECDRAFARLTLAARAVGATEIAERAAGRADVERARRRAATDAARPGAFDFALTVGG